MGDSTLDFKSIGSNYSHQESRLQSSIPVKFPHCGPQTVVFAGQSAIRRYGARGVAYPHVFAKKVTSIGLGFASIGCCHGVGKGPSSSSRGDFDASTSDAPAAFPAQLTLQIR
jgi:hypothetical protein